MIISDENKYVFIQNERTASSSTGLELIANYGGRKILEKHSRYAEFSAVASAEQKTYIVFSGKRNPLDQLVTLYYRSINRNDIPESMVFTEYVEYLRKNQYNFRFNNSDSTSTEHHIRYEYLQEDFSQILSIIGLEQKQPLPRRSKPTEGKQYYLDEYSTTLVRSILLEEMSEAMKREGYSFPSDWTIGCSKV